MHNKRRQQEQSKRAHEEQKARKLRLEQRKLKKQKIMHVLLGSGAALVFIVLGAGAYYAFAPGPYDAFAKCLTEQGAVMYGEEWCPFTKGQKAMFGRSFKHIQYEIKEDLDMRPTWVIAGETYETVQSFERLAALTGCALNGGTT